ncbi:MAG: FAD-dependent oxidoreductase [Thermomicrobia bacterium]|nr:FAD-dependent oxidoreductase [Thermomicrobia bacterium]
MSDRPLRVAVIGSGPAGFYAAEALIKQTAIPVSVDIFDRLPVPYGLVRYGVAPDHYKIKSVISVYEKTLADPRVRFFGHVAFGQDLTRADYRRLYDAVIYAVGASSDRNLGIAGEDLSGSISATEFVAWYNGHPDAATRAMTLDARGVAIVGVGNVAVDVTRILAKTRDELAETDIADHTLPVLAQSAVTDIYVLGRRGPVQAKFTTKELGELGELANADIIVKPEEIALDPVSEAALAGQRVAQRNMEVLRAFATKPLEGKPRRVHLRFLVSPVEILGTERVEGIVLERNRLDEEQRAIGTGDYETLPVQMVLRSVGYKGVPLADVPFDPRAHVVPHRAGRVLERADSAVMPGEYVTGWIKRGPSGLIGTNKADSVETVKSLLEDAPNLPPATEGDPEAVDALLRARNVRYVTMADWMELEKYETALGEAQGRPRVKIVHVEEMLERLGKD